MKKTILSLALYATFFGSLSAQTIINSGFESEVNAPYKMTYSYKKGAVLNNWVLVCHESKNSKGDISVTSTEKYSGDKSMQIKLDQISARYYFFAMYDIKDLTPGKYTFSFFSKADEANVPFRIDILACGGENFATEKNLVGSSGKGKDGVFPADRAGYQAKTSDTWKEYTISFDASNLTAEDMKIIRFIILPNCEKSGLSPIVNSPMTYWFDDFQMSKLTK